MRSGWTGCRRRNADGDEYLDVTANVIDMGKRLELAHSECRSDQLALGGCTIGSDDDVSERLSVLRLDDALFREFVFDRADAARAGLDRHGAR